MSSTSFLPPGKEAHLDLYILPSPQHHPRGIVGFHCLAAPSFQLRNSKLPNNTFKARRHTPTPCRYPSCFQSFLSDTDTRTHYDATNSTIPSYHHVGLHSPLLQVRSHARHQHQLLPLPPLAVHRLHLRNSCWELREGAPRWLAPFPTPAP